MSLKVFGIFWRGAYDAKSSARLARAEVTRLVDALVNASICCIGRRGDSRRQKTQQAPRVRWASLLTRARSSCRKRASITRAQRGEKKRVNRVVDIISSTRNNGVNL